MFCGHLVCTKEEQEILNRNSKKSEQLLKKLMSHGDGETVMSKKEEALKKAEEHKRTLLEYDRTCEKRTQVREERKAVLIEKHANKVSARIFPS